MIKGKSLVDVLKNSLPPNKPKSKEVYQQQVQLWTEVVESGLDVQYGMKLSHLIDYYQSKIYELEENK